MNDYSVGWGGRYLKGVHRFIPASLQQEATVTARAENVVNAAVMAGAAGPPYVLAYCCRGRRPPPSRSCSVNAGGHRAE